MKTVELADATASLSDFVSQAREEAVVVTLKGRPVAALTSIGAETDLENLIVSSDPEFRAFIERSRALYPAGTGLSTDEVRRRLRLPRARRSPGAGKARPRRVARGGGRTAKR